MTGNWKLGTGKRFALAAALVALAAGGWVVLTAAAPPGPAIGAAGRLAGASAPAGYEWQTSAGGIQDTETTVGTLIVDAGRLVNVEVANAADGSSLTDFKVYLQDSKGGEFYEFLSGTDYTLISDSLPWCSDTSPATLASDATTHFHLNVRAAYAVRFRAVGAAAPADPAAVTVRCSVK